MKTLYLILFVIVVSCNPPGAGVSVVEDIRILFEDSEGVNILLKDNPDFTVDDLNLYYYNTDMEYVKWFTGNLDHPNHITGLDDNGLVKMWPVFGEEDGTYIEGGKSTNYLDFGNGDIDTIQVSGIKKSSESTITDAWYNGVHIVNPGRGFTIIK